MRRLSPPRASRTQAGCAQFSTSVRRAAGEREGGDVPHDETFEEFSARYGIRGSESGLEMFWPVRGMEMWKGGPEAPA